MTTVPFHVTYFPFTFKILMSPLNALITGNSLGIFVLSSTPPIHKLPLRLTYPLAKTSERELPSRYTLLLEKHENVLQNQTDQLRHFV